MSFLRTERKTEGKTAEEWFELGFNSTDQHEKLDYYSKTLELNPKHEEAWNNKGVALDDLNRYDEALECYNKALEISKKDEDILGNKGDVLTKMGRYDEALKCYHNALELKPENGDIWNSKGEVLGKLGMYDQALKCFNEALELNPNDEDVLNNRNKMLVELGKNELKHGNNALELNMDDEEACYNKGIELIQMGKYDEALDCYNKALELNPDNEESWYNKGITLGKLNRHDEELYCYDKVLELNPEHEEAWYNKGFALNKLERYEEASECYDKALEINPDDEEAWVNKGELLDKLSRYEEALECYDKAIELYPDDDAAWFNKGELLDKLGRYEEALECYDKALELNPDEEDASKNREIVMQRLEEQKKEEVKLDTKFSSRHAVDTLRHEKYPSAPNVSILKGNIKPAEDTGDLEINKLIESINKTIIEPTSKKVIQEDINITSAFGYKGATIIYKVKIENNTNEPISDIKFYPYVPTVFLLKEKEKLISLIEPKSSQTVTFEIRPTGECGDCNVSGRINYYDMVSKKRRDIELIPKSLSIVCPMLHRKEIGEDAWRDLVSGLVKAEETTTDIPIDGEGLFGIISEILKDLNLFMLPPGINRTKQIFRGTARFYGEGIKGLHYAAQIEVVGGARKSKLILKAWAEKEDALTGFYHGVLDEIEKRVKVKEYIDDSIVQYNIHYGDKIGTLVKDSVVQRSTIGASVRKCPNCGREVEANEKYCLECGAKL